MIPLSFRAKSRNSLSFRAKSRNLHFTLFLLSLPLTTAHAQAPARIAVSVENPLAIVRHDETVGVPWSDVQASLRGVTATGVRVLDAEGREIASQVVDND